MWLRKKATLSIRIRSRSDKDEDEERRLMWGDYWVKHELARAFKELGFLIVENEPDIILHLFGSPAGRLSEDTYNLVWLYSHPNGVTEDNLRQFDRIFCSSGSFISKLNDMGYMNVEFMPASTSKHPAEAAIKYDILFVGNARAGKHMGRSVIADMGLTEHNLRVWGNRWEDILPERYYGGRYYAYEHLEKLYASALITLNDHHKDMAEQGFVSNKIFDILAGGGFAISKYNTGIEDIFEDSVPQYKSAPELKAMVDFFLDNPKERERLMLKGRRIAMTHTYEKRAVQFTKGFILQP